MQSFCRTCFLQISNTSSSIHLDQESSKHQLIFCMPEMDLRAIPDVKLCKDCIAALNIMHKFKIKCRVVEDQFNKQQCIVTKRSTVTQDIRLDSSIYIVCRTCLGDIIENSVHLGERPFYKGELMFCIPEMDLQVTSNFNLCKNCHVILDQIYIFKLKCLDIEKNIKEYLNSHNKVDFMDLSVWCNTFIKYEVSDGLEDYTIKQEEIDLINEDKLTEDVKEQITNFTLISQKIEELKTGECIKKTSKYQNYKCKNSICNNVEYFQSNMSKIKFKPAKCDDAKQKLNLLNCINPDTSKKQFKCLLCEYSAAEKYTLKRHIRRHTGEKPFKCSLCEYSAAHKFDLKCHIRTHTGEKPFKCSLCEYSATQSSTLKGHIRTHTGEKPFKCSLCSYTAIQKSGLKKHISTHTGEKPFKCALCDYSATHKSILKIHIQTHTGEKPFKCSLCNYSAIQKSTVRKHFRTHTGEKPFKCALCEYSAKEKSKLKMHIYTHTGEKPFKCLLCNYSAIQKSTLKIHIRTHNGERPFKCTLCEYSATEKSKLKMHIQIHTGEKPFKCSQCEYSTVQKSKLKRHICTHTGEKPFKCLQCKYSTVQKSKLKRHIHTHTG